ncbi:SDR family NAD(P)-dependent oxidoreductase [Mycolicibacterium moriokaense]|nr:SDR family NAD(P)-dependent oxidoreductase [Mycolicibacterium moriokaense]
MNEPVVLITHADCDEGYRQAQQLLAAGHRVVVTAEHVSRLSRVLLGHEAGRVYAIAADLADPSQRSLLLARCEARFGRVTQIIDGRTGFEEALPHPPLPKAS